MDENLSQSVIKVFEELYKKKLIYKSTKLVNWDTVLKTAISDLEVDQREVNSKLYHIKYPINGTNEFITIATTRPETMLGDTAIAVNPKDGRYKKYKGKEVTVPLVERKIKIIFDNYADPEQGTGAVKITPAHDFNDYEVGKRNNLKIINNLNSIAKKRNQSLSQLALAWVLNNKAVTSALIGVRTVAQLKDNLAALNNLKFTKDEIKKIDKNAKEGNINLWAPSSSY